MGLLRVSSRPKNSYTAMSRKPCTSHVIAELFHMGHTCLVGDQTHKLHQRNGTHIKMLQPTTSFFDGHGYGSFLDDCPLPGSSRHNGHHVTTVTFKNNPVRVAKTLESRQPVADRRNAKEKQLPAVARKSRATASSIMSTTSRISWNYL